MAGRRQTLTAFLDSSVIFTAVNSPIGGSAKLFTLKKVDLVVSTLVLTEVERNIRGKLQNYHLERLFMLSMKLKILNQIPNKNQIKDAQKVSVEKDAPVLASAKLAGADFLVTLDKKHFLTDRVIEFMKPTKVIIPKDFLQSNL